MDGLGALSEHEYRRYMNMRAMAQDMAPRHAKIPYLSEPQHDWDAMPLGTMPQVQQGSYGGTPGGVGPSPEWTMLSENLGTGPNNYMQGQVQSMGIDPRSQFSLEDVIAAYMQDLQ